MKIHISISKVHKILFRVSFLSSISVGTSYLLKKFVSEDLVDALASSDCNCTILLVPCCSYYCLNSITYIFHVHKCQTITEIQRIVEKYIYYTKVHKISKVEYCLKYSMAKTNLCLDYAFSLLSFHQFAACSYLSLISDRSITFQITYARLSFDRRSAGTPLLVASLKDKISLKNFSFRILHYLKQW